MSSTDSSYEHVSESDKGSSQELTEQEQGAWKEKAKKLESDLSILKEEFVEQVKQNSALISTITVLRLQLIAAASEQLRLKDQRAELDKQIEKNAELEIRNSNCKKQMQVLSKYNGELFRDIEDLNEQIHYLEQEPEKYSSYNILKKICGSWKIVDSANMGAYVKRWNTDKFNDALFQVGQPHFRYENEILTMYESMGTRNYNHSWAKLEEWSTLDDCKILSLLENNNKLVTVYLNKVSGEEYARIERQVANKRLFIVMKRFGMKCTRIYEKIPEWEQRKQTKSSDSDSWEEHIQEIEALEQKKKEKNEKEKKRLDAPKLPKLTPSTTAWLGVYKPRPDDDGFPPKFVKIECTMENSRVVMSLYNEMGCTKPANLRWLNDYFLVLPDGKRIWFNDNQLIFDVDQEPVCYVKVENQ